MSASFRFWTTLLMLVGAIVPVAVAATMIADRPALALAMFLTGAAVLVMARFAFRWMLEASD
ncbi:hypothetical protein [Candidatus Poriferisodalis sp.]|uniref:hypothetical protein n=1 Tax=Candidatus Poriferisodalis sp. TaxID=3101277 RepID=UPI003B014088